MGALRDLTGQRFTRLTALYPTKERCAGSVVWKCICICGKKCNVASNNLCSRTTRSCGCLLAEQTGKRFTSHGMSDTSTYCSWTGMHKRCRSNHPRYKDWGGRGVYVEDYFRGPDGFQHFFDYMGERPEGKSLDRYPDNDGGYIRGNMRWATPKEQALNRRDNKCQELKKS